MPQEIITPNAFANHCRKAMETREASWDGKQYSMTMLEACEKVVPKDWVLPIYLLLETGYSDLWDWCDEVAPTP